MQAIAQARDAGDGVLRQEHLREAQHHIARIDPRQARANQHLQGQVLALQGRGGDTRIAHVSPRELVIPHAMQTPAFLQMVAKHARLAGVDPRRLMVGNAQASVNPRTGHQEFGVFFDDGTEPTNYLATPPDSDDDIEGITVTAPAYDSVTDPPPMFDPGVPDVGPSVTLPSTREDLERIKQAADQAKGAFGVGAGILGPVGGIASALAGAPLWPILLPAGILAAGTAAAWWAGNRAAEGLRDLDR